MLNLSIVPPSPDTATTPRFSLLSLDEAMTVGAVGSVPGKDIVDPAVEATPGSVDTPVRVPVIVGRDVMNILWSWYPVSFT